MARLVIHDLTTNYPRIDQTIANLPNAFFGAFNQAQDQQLKRELGDLSKQKTQLELASLGQNMQSQAVADQAWQSLMGGATSAQPLSLGDLGGPASAVGGAYNTNGKTPSFAAIGGSPSQLERQAYDYFIARGWSPAATAGILGNLMAESNLRTNAVNRGDGRDGSDSIGIAQWNGPRAVALRQFAAEQGLDPSTLDAQLAFVDHELRTTERKTGEALRSASDPRAAALIFTGYERPAGWAPSSPERAMHADRRLAHAQRVFTSYGARPEGATQVAQADIPMAGGTPTQGFAIPQGAAPVQTGPTILPNLSTEQLQQLRGMRGLPKERQDLIDMALKERLDQGKPTDAMRGYLFARQQGYAGTFMDYQQELRRAGATNVNVGKGETKYDEEMGKQFAQLNKEIIDGAADGRRKVAVLSRMEGILGDPNVYTGAGANLVLQAKRMAKAMGFDVGDLSGPEAINAISNQFALELRNPSGGAGMPGALSDKDREFLQQSVPGLERTEGANRIIIDYMRRMAQRSVEVDQLRRDYIRENKRLDEGFYDRLAEWSAANPLFTPADEAAVAQALGAGPGRGQPGGAQQGSVAPPQPGTVMDGYVFRGGDPANPNSWERVR